MNIDLSNSARQSRRDMAELLKNVCEKYKRNVRENPDTVGQVETTFRLLSYVIAGKEIVTACHTL